MTAKLSFQEVVDRCNALYDGKYTYDESTYVNSLTKMKCECSEHGVFWMSPANHMRGKKCPACSGVKKLDTAEFIRRAIEVHGKGTYDYSKANYTGLVKKLTIICPDHGEFEQRASDHINQKSGCPKCRGTTRLTSEEFIQKAIEIHGSKFDYSKVDYKNNREKVIIICPDHGEFLMSPSNHLGNKGCPKCANKSMTTADFIEKAKKVHGENTYDYSKVVYVKSNQNVTIICPTHGPFEQRPNNHLSGNGCILCVYEDHPLRMSKDEFIQRAIEKHAGKYTYEKVEYVNADTHVTITCPEHGDFPQAPEKHLGGQGCPSCSHSGPSAAQLEIHAYLSQFTEAILEVNQEHSNYRYDIYLPEHKIAVEYNGLVWHCSRYMKDPRKDIKKYNIAASSGVRMISIYDDEWLNKKEVVLSLLSSAIGVGSKLAARKCEVVTVDSNTAFDFVEKNHIQGGRKDKMNLGLMHNGVLVAVMSFDMLRSDRSNSDPTKWELTRYCSTVNVIGGPSRLLKAFLNTCPSEVSSITSYSDNRLFSGKMYEKLGFKMVGELPADYAYTTGRPEFGRKHKAGYKKSRLAKMFPGCDIENKTEREICEENGLYQIYDCGKRKWVLDPRDLNPNNLTA